MSDALWIVVADASRARFFEQGRPRAAIEHVLPFDLVETRLPYRATVSDRAGRTHERVGHGGHAMAAPTSPAEQRRAAMASHIAKHLHSGRTDGSFSRLMLVAAPAMLGNLRSALDPACARTVVASHAKDLSHLATHELVGRLQGLVEQAAEAESATPSS